VTRDANAVAAAAGTEPNAPGSVDIWRPGELGCFQCPWTDADQMTVTARPPPPASATATTVTRRTFAAHPPGTRQRAASTGTRQAADHSSKERER
jgi:hypothetical protein